MEEFIFRQATINDIPFLVDTIIEAEKSGTDILSYSTVFGIDENKSKEYIAKMLAEEIDGCEISVSSFVVAEYNRITAAALSAWVEGIKGVPSARIKGMLLNYLLPKECILRAASVDTILSGIYIDYIPGTIQKGAMYVAEEFRGKNLIGKLTNYIIEQLRNSHPEVKEVYTQVFSCNIAALKVYEKNGFEIVKSVESGDSRIFLYLPSNKKYLLKKTLI
ncbi:MAG: GNAT family N-acetyltransferase [Bacteroidales bacterium]|nr:GNAT family N-acetyltransferase [Bacteroidales bacterium]